MFKGSYQPGAQRLSVGGHKRRLCIADAQDEETGLRFDLKVKMPVRQRNPCYRGEGPFLQRFTFDGDRTVRKVRGKFTGQLERGMDGDGRSEHDESDE